MRYRLFGLLVVLALAGTHAHAVPLQPGRHYQGGTELEIQAAGLSLTVPEGWVAILPQGGSMLVMTPDDRSYVLAMAEPANLDQARAFLSNPLPLGNGIVLQPAAAPALEGEDLVVPYDVAGGLDATQRVADQVLAGVAVLSGQPQAAQGSGSGGDDDSWQSYLMGRHLVRYYTGSGYNEEQHIYLCSDGHFRKTFGAGGHTTYGEGWSSGAMQSNDAGQWHATGTGNTGTLVLQFGDGSRSDIALEYRDNKVYFDGVQWLRDPENNYCP